MHSPALFATHARGSRSPLQVPIVGVVEVTVVVLVVDVVHARHFTGHCRRNSAAISGDTAVSSWHSDASKSWHASGSIKPLQYCVVEELVDVDTDVEVLVVDVVVLVGVVVVQDRHRIGHAAVKCFAISAMRACFPFGLQSDVTQLPAVHSGGSSMPPQ